MHPLCLDVTDRGHDIEFGVHRWIIFHLHLLFRIEFFRNTLRYGSGLMEAPDKEIPWQLS